MQYYILKGENPMPNEQKPDIKQFIAKISDEKGGWAKELNIIAWNGGEAKLDIRPWTEDHEKMGKGITLSREEAVNLKNALTEYLNNN